MTFLGFIFFILFSVGVSWAFTKIITNNASPVSASTASAKNISSSSSSSSSSKNEKNAEKEEEETSATPAAAPKKKPEGDVPEHFHDNDELAAEATKIRDHARQLKDEAHKPENRGEKYNQLMEEAKAEEARASKLVFDRLNSGKHPKGTIDLHLQYVADAVRICEEEYEKIKNDSEIKEFVVIVGKGNHSEGGKARISPAIEEWADKQGLKHELNEGKVICTL